MANFGSALAQGAVIGITIKAIDEFSKTFKKAGTGMQKLGSVFKAGGLALAGAATGFAMIGKSSVKVASELQKNQIAFTTMMGSAEDAKNMLKELSDFAMKTPFEITDVRRNAKQLMAMGFSAKQVIPVMKSVGDIAAGTGADFSRLVLNLGQVQTQGKLTGRDLRDFLVNGVPLVDQLAKHFGVAKDKIQEMVSKGQVSSKDVIAAFNEMSGAGGKFNNLMQQFAGTAAGQFSNLKDAATRLMESLGTALLPTVSKLASIFINDLMPALQPLIPVLGDFLTTALKKLMPYLPKIVDGFIRLVNFAMKLFDALTPLLDPLMNLAFVIFDALLKILMPLLPSIKELALMFTKVLIAMMPIIPPLTKILTLVAELLDKYLSQVSKIITSIMPAISWFFNKLSDGIKVVSTLVGWVKDLVDWLGKISSGALDTISSVANSVFGGGKHVGDAIIKPNGEIITTNPNDYLIATQNPQSLVSNRGSIIVNIETLQAVDADSVANSLQEVLRDKISI